jgi:hypothetical protein
MIEIKLLIDTKDAKADYKKAPWVEKIIKQCRWHQLLLVQTPQVKPALLHFEPWFLYWTDRYWSH